jgi:hypothetical protein
MNGIEDYHQKREQKNWSNIENHIMKKVYWCNYANGDIGGTYLEPY